MRESGEIPYLYETHLHTREASACAKELCAGDGAGSETIFMVILLRITHGMANTSGSVSPWEEWVGFLCAFLWRKLWRQDRPFCVLRIRTCYQGTEFLIYGVDEEWL